MGKVHVYFRPIEVDGELGDEVEVTDDVLDRGVTPIKEQLDNTEYDVGVLRVSNCRLRLRNDHGRYTEPGNPSTIFPLIRNQTNVRVTWEPGPHKLVCGFFKVGQSKLSQEIELFEGLLDDEATRQNIDDQTITFQILGFQNLFERVEATGITDSMNFEQAIFHVLNRSEITSHLTVNSDNIDCAVNRSIDDEDFFDGKTGLEALAEILKLANSALYIKNRVVHVTPRQATEDLKFSFYGQSSRLGAENILDLRDYSNGMNRLFNLVRWRDTDLISRNADSINEFGVYKHEIDSDVVTNATSRGLILDAYRDEFSVPGIEFQVKTWLTPENASLFLLDRIQVDHPTIVTGAPGQPIPVYGEARYGQAVYPLKVHNLTIPGFRRFKVLSRDIDVIDETLSLHLREIPLL